MVAESIVASTAGRARIVRSIHRREIDRAGIALASVDVQSYAHIVSVTNSDISSYLANELESPSPKRRLAALRATQMLSHSDSVSQYLLPMLEDPRIEVRVRVIDLLSELDGDVLDRLIPVWLNDVSTDIQEAAKRVMRRRERNKKSVASNALASNESES